VTRRRLVPTPLQRLALAVVVVAVVVVATVAGDLGPVAFAAGFLGVALAGVVVRRSSRRAIMRSTRVSNKRTRPRWRWLACLALLSALTASGCSRPTPAPAPTSSPTATTAAPAAGSTAAGTAPTSSSSPSGPANCPLDWVAAPATRCPDPKVTPGTVIPAVAGAGVKVCDVAYNPRKTLTAAAQRRVLAAYGMPPGQVVAEWDHLVARWAGGTSTSSNVWPMVNDADQARKDRLERGLYEAVCRGGQWRDAEWRVIACGSGEQVTLGCAQQMMRTFWRWW